MLVNCMLKESPLNFRKSSEVSSIFFKPCRSYGQKNPWWGGGGGVIHLPPPRLDKEPSHNASVLSKLIFSPEKRPKHLISCNSLFAKLMPETVADKSFVYSDRLNYSVSFLQKYLLYYRLTSPRNRKPFQSRKKSRMPGEFVSLVWYFTSAKIRNGNTLSVHVLFWNLVYHCLSVWDVGNIPSISKGLVKTVSN